MRLTADKIEENNASKEPSLKTAASTPKRQPHPNSLKNLVAPWVPGVSGNPGGRPKYDVAAEIAHAVLANNKQAAYEALSAALLKGNAYVFKELAERGCGKMKERVEVTHLHQDVSDTDLQSRIDELVRDCGLARQVDEVGGVEEPSGRDQSAQVATEDTSVFPR